ncbi:hypothetical protein KKC32_04300 [Patescibacteria group bacterium]|nr:hypothetical protein [Patescibacteria group bacterium]
MDNQNSFGPRKMFQGNWTCSECGAVITELPFEPNDSQPIFCRECHSQRRKASRGTSFGQPRQLHQGNWTCSECGATISELPFEPNGTQPIFCRDCHRARRA